MRPTGRGRVSACAGWAVCVARLAGREWVGPLLREVKGSGPDWVWAERGEKAAGLLPLFYFYLLFPFKLNSTI